MGVLDQRLAPGAPSSVYTQCPQEERGSQWHRADTTASRTVREEKEKRVVSRARWAAEGHLNHSHTFILIPTDHLIAPAHYARLTRGGRSQREAGDLTKLNCFALSCPERVLPWEKMGLQKAKKPPMTIAYLWACWMVLTKVMFHATLDQIMGACPQIALTQRQW